MDACEFVILSHWDVKNSSEMILSQVECYFMLAQCYIGNLLKEGYEIAFADAIKNTEDLDEDTEKEIEDSAKK